MNSEIRNFLPSPILGPYPVLSCRLWASCRPEPDRQLRPRPEPQPGPPDKRISNTPDDLEYAQPSCRAYSHTRESGGRAKPVHQPTTLVVVLRAPGL